MFRIERKGLLDTNYVKTSIPISGGKNLFKQYIGAISFYLRWILRPPSRPSTQNKDDLIMVQLWPERPCGGREMSSRWRSSSQLRVARL